jgi:N-carbamoylputrescine amidase
VGICWDQWFPETARAMALMGADVLLYPTAIGSEPQDPTLDSSDHWQRVMQGHAAANVSFFQLSIFYRNDTNILILLL